MLTTNVPIAIFSQTIFQKEKTKGKKVILEENASTLFFYRTMSAAAFAIYALCCWLLFNEFSWTDQVAIA